MQGIQRIPCWAMRGWIGRIRAPRERRAPARQKFLVGRAHPTPGSTLNYDLYIDDVRLSNSRTVEYNALTEGSTGQIAAQYTFSGSYPPIPCGGIITTVGKCDESDGWQRQRRGFLRSGRIREHDFEHDDRTVGVVDLGPPPDDERSRRGRGAVLLLAAVVRTGGGEVHF